MLAPSCYAFIGVALVRLREILRSEDFAQDDKTGAPFQIPAPRSQAALGNAPACEVALRKRRSTSRARHGFTFVEILACMVFLGVLIPTLVEAISLANRTSIVAERTAVATQLAENKIGELIATQTVNSGDNSGPCGDDWPGYRWEARQQAWETDSMTQLDVQVFFTVQGKEQSVLLSTLMAPDQTQSQSTGQSTSTTTSSSR